MSNLLLLNALSDVDITFFLVIVLIVVVIVAFYFLEPIFRQGQYEMQRENLRKREEAFKANRKNSTESKNDVTDNQNTTKLDDLKTKTPNNNCVENNK